MLCGVLALHAMHKTSGRITSSGQSINVKQDGGFKDSEPCGSVPFFMFSSSPVTQYCVHSPNISPQLLYLMHHQVASPWAVLLLSG